MDADDPRWTKSGIFNIDSQCLLSRIARGENKPSLRELAILQLENGFQLDWIAQNEPNDALRKLAIKRINELLSDLEKHPLPALLKYAKKDVLMKIEAGHISRRVRAKARRLLKKNFSS